MMWKSELSLQGEGNSFFLSGRAWDDFSKIEKLTIFFVLATPTFFLSVKHWVTTASVVSCLLALYVLYSRRHERRVLNVPWVLGVAIVCFGYTVAIAISQLGRADFGYKAYLDQTRWVIGFPIFLFIYWSRINFARFLEFLVPICIISAYISSTYVIPSDAWGGRSTVSFMDPLAFGFMNVSLSLMCLASLVFDVREKKYDLFAILKLAGVLVGAYLSIRSGSRSGWVAVPFVLFLIGYFAFRPKFHQILLMGIAVCALVAGIYFLSATVFARVNETIQELRDYPWLGGVAPDKSVSLRITFYRLGLFYFSESPLFGWGERGYGVIKDAPELASFSSQFARDFAYGALFHSEWTTQAVRYGLSGLVAVGAVFFIPLALFLQRAFSRVLCEQKAALMGIAYLSCQFAASIGDEVFNSKAMITFTVMLLVGLIATLARMKVAGLR